MTGIRAYMARALLVQALVELFSCGRAGATMLPVPQGILTAAEIQSAELTGELIGAMVACMVCLFVIFYLLIGITRDVAEIRRLMLRVLEVEP